MRGGRRSAHPANTCYAAGCSCLRRLYVSRPPRKKSKARTLLKETPTTAVVKLADERRARHGKPLDNQPFDLLLPPRHFRHTSRPHAFSSQGEPLRLSRGFCNGASRFARTRLAEIATAKSKSKAKKQKRISNLNSISLPCDTEASYKAWNAGSRAPGLTCIHRDKKTLPYHKHKY